MHSVSSHNIPNTDAALQVQDRYDSLGQVSLNSLHSHFLVYLWVALTHRAAKRRFSFPHLPITRLQGWGLGIGCLGIRV